MNGLICVLMILVSFVKVRIYVMALVCDLEEELEEMESGFVLWGNFEGDDVCLIILWAWRLSSSICVKVGCYNSVKLTACALIGQCSHFFPTLSSSK